MAKIGIEIRIDVKKIEKERLYHGEKGAYLTMTTFVDTDNKDEYGNNGFIAHKKNEGEDKTPILGNSKIFWSEGLGSSGAQRQPQPASNQQPQQGAPNNPNDFDDDIPF